jgi:hypothetical protein
MTDILSGWRQFADRMNSDKGAAKTWVVNLSAFGEPVLDYEHPPAIVKSSNLLVVAAAGNDNSQTEPLLEAFPRLSNGGTALLIVGALGTDGQKTSYSNYNDSNVQLLARGDCVCGSPGQINGTSQATPIVSSAAAILASARPDWNSLYVMWRLVSTADQSPGFQAYAFGGMVNLAQALEKNILIRELVGGTGTVSRLHRATSVVFDQAWTSALRAQNLDIPNRELLRLYRQTGQPGQLCFTAIEILQFTRRSVCVDADSAIEYFENAVASSLKASEISDLILPMPLDRDLSVKPPNVGLANQN